MTFTKKYSEDDLLKALIEFEEFCRSRNIKPGWENYLEYHYAVNDTRHPSPNTIYKNFGSWHNARSKIREIYAQKGKEVISYNSNTINPSKCQKALDQYIEFCRQTGTSPTISNYRVWIVEQNNAPSVNTMVKNLGRLGPIFSELRRNSPSDKNRKPSP